MSETASNQLEISNSNKKKQRFHVRGILYALLSSCLITTSFLIAKSCYYFKGSDQCIFRYSTQLILMIIFYAWHGSQNRKKSKTDGSTRGNIKWLIVRGIFGTIGLLCAISAIKLINPSDCNAILNTKVILVLLFSRFFLKEKHTIVHIFSLLIAIAGFLFLSQPRFLFGNLNKSQTLINNTSINSTIIDLSFHSVYILPNLQLIGTGLALSSALSSSIVFIVVKKLCDKEVHSSVMMLATSIFGLPASIILSAIFYYIDFKNGLKVFDFETNKLLFQVGMSMVSAVIEVGGQYCTITALKYEDPSKVTLVKSSDVFISFVLQYVFLNIVSGYLNTLGACLIFISVLMVLIHKMFDQKFKSKNKFNLESQSNNFKERAEFLDKAEINKPGLLQKIIFYKF
jgi:drug/metabolite transporter (DMT)-like permease